MLEIKNVNIQSSGIHDFAVFTEVKINEIDTSKIEPCVEVLAQEVIKRETYDITQEEAEEEARAIIIRCLEEDMHKVYKLNTKYSKPRLQLVQRLSLYAIKLKDEYFLVDATDDMLAIEAYQAIVYKSVDIDAFLLKNPAAFKNEMGADIYNECIKSITMSQEEIEIDEKILGVVK